jgi:type IV secretion system protein VirB8
VATASVLMLTPLKSVTPYLVRVDRSTGIVDVVPQFEGGTDLGEAVTRHLLTLYVTTRERYVAALAETDYETVGAYQTAALNQAWLAAWDRNNPDSPLHRYRDGSSVGVHVTSVSFLTRGSAGQDLAQVRFRTGTRAGPGAPERMAYYIATIQYAYAKASAEERLRARNPLGFRVLEYRREPELGPGTVVAEAGP